MRASGQGSGSVGHCEENHHRIEELMRQRAAAAAGAGTAGCVAGPGEDHEGTSRRTPTMISCCASPANAIAVAATTLGG